MAITIDWATKVISIPQADLTFISGTLWELDTDAFRKTLNDLSDDEEGMPFDTTHTHNTEVTIAGVTYARQVILINGYTVTFEDLQYAVRLVGSNNNIFDEGVINRNQVSIISTNSAGLISGESLNTKVDDLHKVHGLDLANPLLVKDTTRDAGAGLSQTIVEAGGTTTVKRV